MTLAAGLATGIGSLPFQDPERAVETVLRYCPQLPYWPQLPRRTLREGMVAQFCEGVPCLRLGDKGVLFDPGRKDEELEGFYARLIDNDTDSFALSEGAAAGLYALRRRLRAEPQLCAGISHLKCHITGPFTMAASLRDERGVLLLHDPVFVQALIQSLTRKALWQAVFLQEFKKPFIIFIDEPYLGCFGSAYTPLNREEVVKGLAELSGALAQEGMLVGVHCCGNTDWSIFTEVPGIGIINFDAYSFLDTFVLYADPLKGFLQRGGSLCWGIVPTNEPAEPFAVADLLERLSRGCGRLCGKGIPEPLLAQRLLVSPACGLGTLSEDAAEARLRSLSAVSASLRQSAPA